MPATAAYFAISEKKKRLASGVVGGITGSARPCRRRSQSSETFEIGGLFSSKASIASFDRRESVKLIVRKEYLCLVFV